MKKHTNFIYEVYTNVKEDGFGWALLLVTAGVAIGMFAVFATYATYLGV